MEVRSEPFPAVMHKNPVQSQPSMSNMRLTFTSDGTSIYKQVPSAPPPYQSSGTAVPLADAPPNPPSQQHGLNWSSRDPGKRKRGRPKKYGSDGAMKFTSMAMQTSPVHGGGSAGFASPVGATSPPVAPPVGLPTQLGSAGAARKARSRPHGSLKKHQMSGLGNLAGSAGTGFTADVLTVKAGEDVSSVLMSFLQHGSRALCILSANGSISNVTLRQAATSGGTVTYEGRFEILSLSGSFLFSESGGQRSRTGGLSISLAGPDGRVLGGGVAGLLTAASPVQVVVGSFIAEQKKEVKHSNLLDPGWSPRPLSASNAGASSPPSRGTLSESSGGPGSPPHQNAGYNNGNQRPISSMPSWK